MRIVAGIVLLFLLLMTSYLSVESMQADRTAASGIHQGMSRSQVVELLGVFYDEYRLGEYEDVDAVISDMENADSITRVDCWRIAHSQVRFWVAFDSDDAVIATHFETR